MAEAAKLVIEVQGGDGLDDRPNEPYRPPAYSVGPSAPRRDEIGPARPSSVQAPQPARAPLTDQMQAILDAPGASKYFTAESLAELEAGSGWVEVARRGERGLAGAQK